MSETYCELIRAVIEHARALVRTADEFPPEEVGENGRWAGGDDLERLIDRMDMLAVETPQISLRVEAEDREALISCIQDALTEAENPSLTSFERWEDNRHIRLIVREEPISAALP